MSPAKRREEKMLFTRRQSVIAGCWAFVGTSLLSNAPAVAESEEGAVEQAAQALRKAMLDADRAALDALVAPEMIYVHSDGHAENKTQYVDVIANKKTIYSSITLSNVKTVVAGDTAIVHLVFDCTYQDEGKPPASAHLGVMETWQKQGGSWKLLARQGYHI
jgi:ketosteroid isomerase-like protein